MPPQSSTHSEFDPRLRYPVEAALKYLGTSRKSLYAMIASGAIKTIEQGARTIQRGPRAGKRIAGRRYIPGSEIARLSSVPA